MQRLKQKRIIGIIIVVLLLLGFWLWVAIYYFLETPSAPHHTITRPAKIKPPKVELTYQEMFQLAAAEYNLEWRFLEALAYQESRLNALAVSPTDDRGLMQISPATWDEWALKVGVDDPFDPYSNILVGAAYLAFVRDLCLARGHTEPHCMLVGYHWGPNRLDRFFQQGGTWSDIPPVRREYADGIVTLANGNLAAQSD